MATTSAGLPEQIELCRHCRAGLVFYLPGDEDARKHPYCPKCGAKEPGTLYVRTDPTGPERRV